MNMSKAVASDGRAADPETICAPRRSFSTQWAAHSDGSTRPSSAAKVIDSSAHL
jgi:hypothetical protein